MANYITLRRRQGTMALQITENEIEAVLREKTITSEQRANAHLANANLAAENGDPVEAERLYALSQFWLDRYNKLAGNH